MMWGWWQANFWEGARGGRAFVFASHFCDYVQLQVEVRRQNEDILCFVPQARLQTPWQTFLEQWSRDWGRDEGQDATWEKSTRSNASLFASPEGHEESFWDDGHFLKYGSALLSCFFDSQCFGSNSPLFRKVHAVLLEGNFCEFSSLRGSNTAGSLSMAVDLESTLRNDVHVFRRHWFRSCLFFVSRF